MLIYVYANGLILTHVVENPCYTTQLFYVFNLLVQALKYSRILSAFRALIFQSRYRKL